MPLVTINYIYVRAHTHTHTHTRTYTHVHTYTHTRTLHSYEQGLKGCRHMTSTSCDSSQNQRCYFQLGHLSCQTETIHVQCHFIVPPSGNNNFNLETIHHILENIIVL